MSDMAHDIGVAAEMYRMAYERLLALTRQAAKTGMPAAVLREATGPLYYDHKLDWWAAEITA